MLTSCPCREHLTDGTHEECAHHCKTAVHKEDQIGACERKCCIDIPIWTCQNPIMPLLIKLSSICTCMQRPKRQ